MDAKKNFEDVCYSLNMDRETADSAWSIYHKIDEDYGLEVSLIRLVVYDIKELTYNVHKPSQAVITITTAQ